MINKIIDRQMENAGGLGELEGQLVRLGNIINNMELDSHVEVPGEDRPMSPGRLNEMLEKEQDITIRIGRCLTMVRKIEAELTEDSHAKITAAVGGTHIV